MCIKLTIINRNMQQKSESERESEKISDVLLNYNNDVVILVWKITGTKKKLLGPVRDGPGDA